MQISSQKTGAPFWRSGAVNMVGKCTLLAALIIWVYHPVRFHDFINYDDNVYIYANPYVAAGFTWQGLKRAFCELYTRDTYWHPLTWVSHMLDAEWFGLEPGAHHMVSVILHAINAVLLYVGLRWLTNKDWPALLAAGLFALHPLQLDTVAWAAERKNLLHMLFGMLTVWAYANYVQKGRRSWYALAVTLFGLGLMCKPALVTLPFALLLLDYWPLGRIPAAWNLAGAGRAGSVWRERMRKIWPLVREKVPFLILTLGSIVITLVGHHDMGALGQHLPLGVRIGNAVIAYLRYLKKLICPNDLAIFYPYSTDISGRLVVVAVVVLAAISLVCIVTVRSRPWLLVGWLWFLGNLVPTIGVVQAGSQAMADRFSYLPMVGVFTAAAYLVFDTGFGVGRTVVKLRVVLAGILIALTLLASRWSLPRWKNSETIFEHAIKVTGTNWVAEEALGGHYFNLGRYAEAERHLRKSVVITGGTDETFVLYASVLDRLGRTTNGLLMLENQLKTAKRPAVVYQGMGELWASVGAKDKAIASFVKAIEAAADNGNARLGLAGLLVAAENWSAAGQQYRKVLERDPMNVLACVGMAQVALAGGNTEEALAYLRRAPLLQFYPAECDYNVGVVFGRMGRLDAAEENYLGALRKRPDYFDANYNLANLHVRTGRFALAAEYFRRALAKQPGSAEARSNLALTLASMGNLDAAVQEYRATVKVAPNLADAHYGLARVLELQTNLVEAAVHYRTALVARTNLHEARLGLGVVLNQQQRWGEAVGQLEVFVKANPASGIGRHQLGIALVNSQRSAEALPHLERAVELRPRDRSAANLLARVLATAGDASVRNARRAVQVAEGLCLPREAASPEHLATLAAAYAGMDDFAKAVETIGEALRRGRGVSDPKMVKEWERELEQYRAGKPVRDR